MIDQLGPNGPSVADVEILLAPVKCLDIPGNVAVWLSARRIKGWDGIVSTGLEVASTQPLGRGQIVF